MTTSKGVHRLSILGGIVGAVGIASAINPPTWQGAIATLVIGFLVGLGAVRLVAWFIGGFKSDIKKGKEHHQ